MILVTGGAGFIGSNFVLEWLKDPATTTEPIVTLDALNYAGNRENLSSLDGDSRHIFVQGHICDRVAVFCGDCTTTCLLIRRVNW